MGKVIIKHFIVYLVVTTFLVDSSFLFCLKNHSEYDINVNHKIGILDKYSENHKDFCNDHNHHNPFHHFNHSSQINFAAGIHNIFLQTVIISDEIPGLNILDESVSQILCFQHRHRFRTSREQINLLSILLI